jgi:hypothetical protein
LAHYTPLIALTYPQWKQVLLRFAAIGWGWLQMLASAGIWTHSNYSWKSQMKFKWKAENLLKTLSCQFFSSQEFADTVYANVPDPNVSDFELTSSLLPLLALPSSCSSLPPPPTV